MDFIVGQHQPVHSYQWQLLLLSIHLQYTVGNGSNILVQDTKGMETGFFSRSTIVNEDIHVVQLEVRKSEKTCDL